MNNVEGASGFSADYQFLKWLIKKYKDILPYCGEIQIFAKEMNYTKNISFFWNRDGIPPRVWIFIHKDLVIARLMGKIKEEDVRSLPQLKKEYMVERNKRLGKG